MINKKAKNIIMIICIIILILLFMLLNIIDKQAKNDCLKLHDKNYCKQAINDLKK